MSTKGLFQPVERRARPWNAAAANSARWKADSPEVAARPANPATRLEDLRRSPYPGAMEAPDQAKVGPQAEVCP